MSVRLRCDDVTRELAATSTPAGAGIDPVALADHLAACPPCASWAARDARLTRLWAATRPEEPSAAAWEAVWAKVSDRLDRDGPVEVVAPEPSVIPMTPAQTWPRWGLALFSLAQAAAILVAVGLLASRPSATVVASAKVDIDQGQVVMIRSDVQGVNTVALLSEDGGSNVIDDHFAMFNALEAMAE